MAPPVQGPKRGRCTLQPVPAGWIPQGGGRPRLWRPLVTFWRQKVTPAERPHRGRRFPSEKSEEYNPSVYKKSVTNSRFSAPPPAAFPDASYLFVLKKLHRIFVSHVLSSRSLSLTPVPVHHFCCFSCSHNDSTGYVQYPSTTSPNRISSPSKTPDGTASP